MKLSHLIAITLGASRIVDFPKLEKQQPNRDWEQRVKPKTKSKKKNKKKR